MMKRGRKAVLIVVVLAVVLSVATIIMINVPKEPEKALLKVMSDRVDLQVRNIRLTEVGDSGMKWEIMADTARYQKKENLAFLEKLKVKLVTKDNRTFMMTGDRGRLNTESRDMEIEGNVDIVSDNGDRFRTDHLRYLNAGKLIETEGSVVMENKSIRVSGVGMTLYLEEKRSRSPIPGPGEFHRGTERERMMLQRICTLIIGVGVLIAALGQPINVHGQAKQKPKVERDQPIQIVSDRLDAYNEKRMVVFSGNAVATQGERTIRADVLTLYYKEEKKPAVPSATPSTAESEGPGELERVEAKGHVTISEGDRIVTGEEAIYEQDAQKITMTGNAVLREGANIIRGDKVVRIPE